MIDYFKIKCYVKSSIYLKNISLDFKESYSRKSGLIDKKIVSKYNCMEVELYDNGLLIIKGSLHKFWNHLNNVFAPNQTHDYLKSKGFNGNNFSYMDIAFALSKFEEIFNVELSKCTIMNLEFGLNITHFFHTESILNGLMLHKGNIFTNSENFVRKCPHQRYLLKIYNKASQYAMIGEIIRQEIHYDKMIELKELNIQTLNDLLRKEIYISLKEKLIYELDNMVFYDYTINTENLSKIQKSKLKDYSNPLFWKELKPIHRDRPKKQLASLIEANSMNIKEQLKILITEKVDSLLKERKRFNSKINRIHLRNI